MALADIYINQKRYDDVIKLSKDYLKFDPVLLRYVRALNIQGDLTTNGYFCELKRKNIYILIQNQNISYISHPILILHWMISKSIGNSRNYQEMRV